MAEKIKVMIVDDSIVVQQVIMKMLQNDPWIEVISTASDPVMAREKMDQRWPDVLILDVEMPRMDGLSFLAQLMNEHPTPTVVCSSMVVSGSKIEKDALAAGAVSVICKPRVGVRQFLEENTTKLCQTIRMAARADLKGLLKKGRARAPSAETAQRATLETFTSHAKLPADAVLTLNQHAPVLYAGERFIAIGTSTGGTQALESVLTKLPEDTLGLVIVQHMPANFSASMFTERLNGLCALEVREARQGDRIRPGLALVAASGRHMLVKREGLQYRIEIRNGPPVSRHIPSVDVLFRSVANSAGPNALGIIMTGMGDDGAIGLKEMRDAGAKTIAQDEASCIVFGMPKEAIRLGAANEVLSLNKIPEAITAYGREYYGRDNKNKKSE
ncbi:MAG: chemotaxis response regulator protein-glutamate methylesterase [Zoogloeaceae bacterium]|jgi:two-component system chemotaxis response regulator CheB|nr:chemotaxis response regulator protein-glutamate methylesterase [Zoogloeaceae bacterium]